MPVWSWKATLKQFLFYSQIGCLSDVIQEHLHKIIYTLLTFPTMETSANYHRYETTAVHRIVAV